MLYKNTYKAPEGKLKISTEIKRHARNLRQWGIEMPSLEEMASLGERLPPLLVFSFPVNLAEETSPATKKVMQYAQLVGDAALLINILSKLNTKGKKSNAVCLKKYSLATELLKNIFSAVAGV